MNVTLMAELLRVVGPVAIDLLRSREAAGDRNPSIEQIVKDFKANADKYLAEGAAWRATHPNA